MISNYAILTGHSTAVEEGEDSVKKQREATMVTGAQSVPTGCIQRQASQVERPRQVKRKLTIDEESDDDIDMDPPSMFWSIKLVLYHFAIIIGPSNAVEKTKKELKNLLDTEIGKKHREKRRNIILSSEFKISIFQEQNFFVLFCIT